MTPDTKQTEPTKPTEPTFAEQLKFQRLMLRYTQVECARALGISARALWTWEKGANVSPLKKEAALARLAALAELPVDISPQEILTAMGGCTVGTKKKARLLRAARKEVAAAVKKSRKVLTTPVPLAPDPASAPVDAAGASVPVEPGPAPYKWDASSTDPLVNAEAEDEVKAKLAVARAAVEAHPLDFDEHLEKIFGKA